MSIVMFKVGQRVRPSDYGISQHIFPGSKAARRGTVTKVDQWNSPTVLWDGLRTTTRYFSGFIRPVREGRSP